MTSRRGRPAAAVVPEVIPGTVAVAFLDDDTWSACFGMSYRDLIVHDLAGPQRMSPQGAFLELRMLTGSGGIPTNRNRAVGAFLDMTPAEWLWFIDTDMGFEPDTVDRLVKAADPQLRPVMAGLCFAGLRTGRPTAATMRAARVGIRPTLYETVEVGGEVGFNPRVDYPRDQVVQVDGTGAACLLIHRSAAEAVRARYGPAWFDPIIHPTGDKGAPRTFSEDLSFCVRLRACDIPVHVDTSVKTTHHKGLIYLDETTFDEQREG